jgi:hypothetical protein
MSVSVVNNAVRTRSRGLDGDMLYDLPDEPLSGPQAPKKRRKTSTKPARPKKASSSILAHPWPKVTEKESSQLSTPLDSKKRSSKRSSTQTELFSSASITKPIRSPMKLITTEDILKAKSVSLGQTTMEKLAAFRFQPPLPCLADVEAHGMADSMEEVVDDSFLAHGLPDDATSHDEENPHHVFDDHNSTSHSEEGLYDVFDEANVLDHDEDMIMLGREEISMAQREATSIVQPDSEDDFPLDDELETEMAQLSMPDKTCEKLSQSVHPESLQNERFPSSNADGGHFPLSSPVSHTLVGNSDTATNFQSGSVSSVDSVLYLGTFPRPLDEAVDWPSTHEEGHYQSGTAALYPSGAIHPPERLALTISPVESDEYAPLKPFARPGFPSKVSDRSPISGVSSNIVLRTCFRIGEALREGALCERLGQDAVIELFARVTLSSKDATSFKLHFHFADLFHGRPPFIHGTLENAKISGLQETESRILLDVDSHVPMVRCLGRLKRVIAGPPGWMLHIINIRATDWEEVRWTRKVAGAGMMK